MSSEQLQKSSQVFIDIHNFLPLQVSKTASVSNVTIIRERSSSSKLKAVIVIVVVSMHTKINAIAPICPLPSSFIALQFNCNQMFSYKANNKIKWLAMVISNSCCVAIRSPVMAQEIAWKLIPFEISYEIGVQLSFKEIIVVESRRQIASWRNLFSNLISNVRHILFLFCGTISNANGAKSHSTIKWSDMQERDFNFHCQGKCFFFIVFFFCSQKVWNFHLLFLFKFIIFKMLKVHFFKLKISLF